jgi:AraC-like DNA-binding protein
MVCAIGLALLTQAIDIAVDRFGEPELLRSFAMDSFYALALLSFSAIITVRRPDLFGSVEIASAEPNRRAPSDPLVRRLLDYMEAEKAWRNASLTVLALAEQLGEQEYRLRRAINGGLGHRNFSQFLNGFRLVEVRQALADPEQNEVSILTIALDAGFGSLAAFNRVFREAEGITPSEFRRRSHLSISESL